MKIEIKQTFNLTPKEVEVLDWLHQGGRITYFSGEIDQPQFKERAIRSLLDKGLMEAEQTGVHLSNVGVLVVNQILNK